MTIEPISGYRDDEFEEATDFFHDSLNRLHIDKVNTILTKIRCEVESESGAKVPVDLIAKVSKWRTQVLGFVPVISTGVGLCRVSVGMAKVALAVASIGAANLLGLSSSPLTQAFVDAALVKEGFINLLPLAAGALVMMKEATPSFDVMVTDFSVSEDRVGVVKHYVSHVASKAFGEDEKLTDLKLESRKIIQIYEKTFSVVSKGVKVVVTCAPWIDIAKGVVEIVVSPFIGGATLPSGVMSVARGSLVLAGPSIVESVKSKILPALMERIGSYFDEEEKEEKEIPLLTDKKA